MNTSTYLLVHDDEKPQRNAKNAYLCATRFSYDNVGRLVGTGAQYPFLGTALSNSYGYDADSNRVSFSNPQSQVTSYSYDSLNRLTSLSDPNTGSFGFGYDADGRRTSLTRPNGVNTSYSYDTLSRLLGIEHAGGALPGSTSYTYDPAGNRLTKTAVEEINGNPSSVQSQYSYDNIYELTQAVVNGSVAESYSYDAVGNRLTSAGPTSYTVNSSNELTSDSNATFTYDNNGNTLSKTTSSGITNYTWDFENRLTSMTLPGTGGTVNFRYDPFGRRIYKSSSAGTYVYVYDGNNVIQQLNGAGATVAEYTQGLGIDEPLGLFGGGATSYYYADGLGSITSLTGTSGNLAASYVYDSFGNLTASTGTIANPFQYTAREFDAETGAYYYRARYYDPMIGRFATEDPVRFPGGVDFYSYVENDPVALVDPYGLCAWQVDSRPLKGVPPSIAGPLGLSHYYFYNPQTGQSIGLAPAQTTVTGPVPGTWETNEKQGTDVGSVPDWACDCVTQKAKNPGNPPQYCTLKGKTKVNAPCMNCMGWVNNVLQDCYNQAYRGQ